MPSRLNFDHVFRAVSDLGRASDEFHDRYGLASVAGGRHEGHGTANRIIPLGKSYIELIAVVDFREAAESSLGRWVARRTELDHPWDGLVLRSPEVTSEAERLDLEVSEFSRMAPHGRLLRWSMAGLDHLLEDDLPFFIAFEGPPDGHPGRDHAGHAMVPDRIRSVVWSGVANRLAAWVGDADLDLTITDDPGRRSITISTDQGDLTL